MISHFVHVLPVYRDIYAALKMNCWTVQGVKPFLIPAPPILVMDCTVEKQLLFLFHHMLKSVFSPETTQSL